MRVLLDHNLPHKLRTNLGTRAAEESGIEVFITGELSQRYESETQKGIGRSWNHGSNLPVGNGLKVVDTGATHISQGEWLGIDVGSARGKV